MVWTSVYVCNSCMIYDAVLVRIRLTTEKCTLCWELNKSFLARDYIFACTFVYFWHIQYVCVCVCSYLNVLKAGIRVRVWFVCDTEHNININMIIFMFLEMQLLALHWMFLTHYGLMAAVDIYSHGQFGPVVQWPNFHNLLMYSTTVDFKWSKNDVIDFQSQ